MERPSRCFSRGNLDGSKSLVTRLRLAIYEFLSCSTNIPRVAFQPINRSVPLKRPSHGKLKLANSCWQTQVGMCERHKNSRQTRFYLTPTICKRVCRLFLCRSHTPTRVCQHEFANVSLPCEGRLTVLLCVLDPLANQQTLNV